MPGLIPLMLHAPGAASRRSILLSPGSSAFPLSSPPPTQTTLKRMGSLDAAAARPKARSPKRLSLQAPASLPVLPYTAADWNKAVAEVKRHYSNRQYRACSARCCEILDNFKDQANVEPTYLIYLHFYAATSVEMLARPLNTSSPYRVKLLNQARAHYARAAELIQTADETISTYSRPSSAATTAPSLHSPSCSISSRSSTELSSPTASICSLEDAMAKLANTPAPLQTKKRVTFIDDLEPMIQEPFIRPDSPTLGFDDLRSSPVDGSRYLPSLQEVPESKLPAAIAVAPSASAPTPEPPIEDSEGNDYGYLRERSIHRYCALLVALRSQIASHLAAVDAQLAPQASTIANHRLSFSVSTRAATPDVDDEMRALDLKARIERLRASGWKRQRFNPRRYEELRESVLAEMA
ncbi:hypothetical protein HYQ45_010253 [Verticillium longisporum]|uniref:Uncharacterized protein n=3 Tax=Verticillium TaxID=1036719 RepID=G2X2E9_VERDV|nr:uncharacterized protein VDAG_04473 [Verticillium dahliae VdLs.17]KAF3346151.1 Actin-related protein 2/3 complex subunit 1 [Verticillium dahliae VDG2]KAG7131075.1 hypothetical protein HYQ45_010253 [Verticillium longisporum]KAH6700176.1 hypothetical protein EV126DRAFT_28989 [Verticillium dahliae]EGY23035.1 hypothetical protein VDAG_04473 [Verticillium dahliae VdLs.17]PNH32086.1 hypothetical protein BJF96_g4721 [Verticillium dahliae]